MAINAPDTETVLDDLKRTVDKLKAFDEIGKALTSTLNLKEILELLLQKISVFMKPSYWALFLLVNGDKQLIPEIAVAGAKKKKTGGVVFAPDQGIIGWVIKNGQGVFITNPKSDPRFDKEVDGFLTPHICSVMIVPLKFRQRVLGVIQYVSQDPYDNYNAEDYSTLIGFGDYLAIAIENARNFERVQQLTISDDLTRLYNSRYLYMMLDREFMRYERYREPFSLLFLDLDNLKKINDSEGHLAGSQILVEIGNVILDECRISDIPIRYGGDEFIVVMPKTGKKDAIKFARRLRERINTTTFLKEMKLNARVTASFGLASVPENAKTRDELIQMADQAMYSVKKTTKDGIAQA